jgi:hypothetical protein
MTVISFAAYSKAYTTEKKLHIIPFIDMDERNAHFGRHVKSHCGLIGIFLQNDRLEGIEEYCRRFEKIDTEYFFIPIRPIDFETGQTSFFKDDMICNNCRKRREEESSKEVNNQERWRWQDDMGRL